MQSTKDSLAKEINTKTPSSGYKVGNFLGKGSFGQVRRGEHIETGESVAMKILEKSRLKKPEDVERVKREIDILMKVYHPNVVQLYEVIESDTQVFLVMEYISNGNLQKVLDNRVYQSEKEAANYYQQIIAGIEYLHMINCAHRDLKPENLQLDEDNTLKIADFGLGTSYNPCELLKTPCGSPCFAAPEMISGKKYDPLAVDIWSSGISQYQMLTGNFPFIDESIPELYKKIFIGKFELPEHLSMEAKDLLRGVQDQDSRTRLRLKEIKKHPFFSTCRISFDKIQIGQNLKYKSPYQDKRIVDGLIKKYGIQKKYIDYTFQKNKFNSIRSYYYLEKQKLNTSLLEAGEPIIGLFKNTKALANGAIDHEYLYDRNCADQVFDELNIIEKTEKAADNDNSKEINTEDSGQRKSSSKKVIEYQDSGQRKSSSKKVIEKDPSVGKTENLERSSVSSKKNLYNDRINNYMAMLDKKNQNFIQNNFGVKENLNKEPTDNNYKSKQVKPSSAYQQVADKIKESQEKNLNSNAGKDPNGAYTKINKAIMQSKDRFIQKTTKNRRAFKQDESTSKDHPQKILYEKQQLEQKPQYHQQQQQQKEQQKGFKIDIYQNHDIENEIEQKQSTLEKELIYQQQKREGIEQLEKNIIRRNLRAGDSERERAQLEGFSDDKFDMAPKNKSALILKDKLLKESDNLQKESATQNVTKQFSINDVSKPNKTLIAHYKKNEHDLNNKTINIIPYNSHLSKFSESNEETYGKLFENSKSNSVFTNNSRSPERDSLSPSQNSKQRPLVQFTKKKEDIEASELSIKTGIDSARWEQLTNNSKYNNSYLSLKKSHQNNKNYPSSIGFKHWYNNLGSQQQSNDRSLSNTKSVQARPEPMLTKYKSKDFGLYNSSNHGMNSGSGSLLNTTGGMAIKYKSKDFGLYNSSNHGMNSGSGSLVNTTGGLPSNNESYNPKKRGLLDNNLQRRSNISNNVFFKTSTKETKQ